MTGATETATFGAGCFWHVEHAFEQVPGVVATEVGYMGGRLENPSYKQVCTDRTGHAEVCQVRFAPEKVSYEQLLDAFWRMHDPTTPNRQGPDVGTQYRSVVFYHSEAQREVAQASLAQAQRHFAQPIVTQIVPAGTFWQAEAYHQDYFKKNGKACGI